MRSRYADNSTAERDKLSLPFPLLLIRAIPYTQSLVIVGMMWQPLTYLIQCFACSIVIVFHTVHTSEVEQHDGSCSLYTIREIIGVWPWEKQYVILITHTSFSYQWGGLLIKYRCHHLHRQTILCYRCSNCESDITWDRRGGYVSDGIRYQVLHDFRNTIK